jgi:hypothetical protein
MHVVSGNALSDYFQQQAICGQKLHCSSSSVIIYSRFVSSLSAFVVNASRVADMNFPENPSYCGQDTVEKKCCHSSKVP